MNNADLTGPRDTPEPTPRSEAIVFMLSAVVACTTAIVSPSIYKISFVFFGYASAVGAAAVFLSSGSGRTVRTFFPAVTFVSFQTASVLWSVNLNSTVSYSLMFAAMVMFGMMCMHAGDGGFHEGLLRVVGVVTLIVSLYGIYQYAIGFERSQEYLREFGGSEIGLADSDVKMSLGVLGYKRAFSTFMSPNALASFIACSIPLVGYLFLRARSGWRAFHGASMLAALVALGLTRSVGGLLAFCVGAGVFVAVAAANSRPEVRKKILTAAVAAAVVLSVAGYAVVESRAEGFLGLGTSVKERMSYWSGALEIGLERPVAGYGSGTFHTMYLGRVDFGGSESRYAHNVFLQTFAETGIIGLVTLAVLFMSYFRRAATAMARGGDGMLFAALCASGAAFVAHNLVDFTFYLPSGALLFWMCYGIAGSLSRDRDTVSVPDLRSRYITGTAGTAVVVVFVIFFGLSHIARQKLDHAISLLAAAGINSTSELRTTPPPGEAVELAEAAVGLKPYDAAVHSFLAGLYEGMAYKEGPQYALKAESEYLDAIELDPYYPYHYRDLGILYFKLGRKELAVRYVSKAVSLYPKDRNLLGILKKIES